jgi:hypothetical protein
MNRLLTVICVCQGLKNQSGLHSIFRSGLKFEARATHSNVRKINLTNSITAPETPGSFLIGPE